MVYEIVFYFVFTITMCNSVFHRKEHIKLLIKLVYKELMILGGTLKTINEYSVYK